MNSLVGQLLIAPPDERDLDFIGTVILLIQHSEEQAVGVVLNRSTTKTVSKVWKAGRRCDCQQVVYSGGPVSGPLMALHTDESLADLEILPGVYYSVQANHLERLVHAPTGPFKMFISHVGWGPGQLERFVEAGRWVTAPATRDYIFDPGPGLWEKLSKPVEPSGGDESL